MGLNDFRLSPKLISELYKNSLIFNQLGDTKLSSPPAGDVPFLGKNQKNITVIVNEKNAVYLPDEMLEFLIGILDACKLSLSDIGLMNLNSIKEMNYNMIQEKFKPGIILLFGVDPAQIGFPLHFPHYQLQAYNKQTYLSAPSLDQLAGDKLQKQQLWASLKKLFLL